ncbi:MAG: DUF5602 domain-containing protein [Cytophagales bacterium]|jgi:hypothetical protein|nr:DUF5602 domain-containing protein [Cytophagales bacterium]
MRRSNSFIVLIISLFVTFTACKQDDDNNAQEPVVYGPEVAVGNGKARSLIRRDASGNPTAIGFVFSEQALQGLPDGHGGTPGTPHETPHVLSLPEGKEKTPYDHISFDWTPHGHEPVSIYGKPHFDIHFYKITQAERASIAPGPDMEELPDSTFLPPTYFTIPGEGVPQMGKHWVDGTAPEIISGKPFTATFIYGSYNGKVIFHEPMVTRDFLLSKPDTLIDIKQPQAVDPTGRFYPTKYSIRFDAAKAQYTILLEAMQMK